VETRKIKDLVPYDRNPRKNGPAIDKVLESLNRHGQVKPIVLSAVGKPFEKEVICCGHTTMQALKKFGAKEAKVIVKEFESEAEFIDYNIRDNKSGEFAEWDEAMLAQLGAEFEIDLGEMGFEFNAEESKEGLTDEDDVPEVPAEPVAKLGQMWKLDDHRLMCGDSTDREQVEKLMGGEKADLCLTDPPYGIGEDGGAQRTRGSKRKNGEKKEWDKQIPSKEAFENIKIYSEVQMIWGGNYFTDYLSPSRGWFYWNKLMGGDFSDGELCWTSRDAVLKHFEKAKITKDRMHTTQKPIELMEWCLSFSESSVVLDLFGGSGSTLIACEKTGRKCRMMELDPKYCDVIIKRWEDFTGKKAELI
jgi:hypothetical protein